MRISLLLCCVCSFSRRLRSEGSGRACGFIPVVFVGVVVWASMGVAGVAEGPPAAETGGPGAAMARVVQDEDDADDQTDDTGLLLEVDRLVPLDMTEGSWISLDVSPDGETIVFDFLGDLFTTPIAGGDATQLTSGMAFDAQPRFSPDGSRILYTSDADGGQNVWVMASDGSDPVQISKGPSNRAESPEWMPDGDYVVAAMGAFRLSGLPKLKLFHVDGGSGVQLISEPDNLQTLGPAVSPDGGTSGTRGAPATGSTMRSFPSTSSRPTTWRPASATRARRATGRPCGPPCRRTGGGWSSGRGTTSTRG